MISVASILQHGTTYVLQVLNINHIDLENIICLRKCCNMQYQPSKSIQCRYGVYLLSKQTYVGKPLFLCTVFNSSKNKPDNSEIYTIRKPKLFIYQKLQGLWQLWAVVNITGSQRVVPGEWVGYE
jgi:hypothetical protein